MRYRVTNDLIYACRTYTTRLKIQKSSKNRIKRKKQLKRKNDLQNKRNLN